MPVRRMEFIGTRIENLSPDHVPDYTHSDAVKSLTIFAMKPIKYKQERCRQTAQP